jgi:hypothetical protein
MGKLFSRIGIASFTRCENYFLICEDFFLPQKQLFPMNEGSLPIGNDPSLTENGFFTFAFEKLLSAKN